MSVIYEHHIVLHMDIKEELESEFDADVTVERTTDARGHEATAEFTVYCESDDEDEVRERLAELEADIAFEPVR